MLPNSSSTPKGDGQSEEKPAGIRRSGFSDRRIGLAILLPLWVVAGFYLSLVLLSGIIKALVFAGVSLDGMNTSVQETLFAALGYLLTAVIVIGLPRVIKKSRTTLSELGLDRLPTWKDIGLAIVGFMIYLLFAAVLISLVTKYVPGFNAEEVQDVGFKQLNGRYEYLLAFVTLVVIAPVAEEVLMRGYLYGKLRKIVGVVIAMVVTAALFAALHLQWNVAVDVFALSLILTSLRDVSGSIWSGILVHMMKNGLAFYLLFINTSLLRTIGG